LAVRAYSSAAAEDGRVALNRVFGGARVFERGRVGPGRGRGGAHVVLLLHVGRGDEQVHAVEVGDGTRLRLGIVGQRALSLFGEFELRSLLRGDGACALLEVGGRGLRVGEELTHRVERALALAGERVEKPRVVEVSPAQRRARGQPRGVLEREVSLLLQGLLFDQRVVGHLLLPELVELALRVLRSLLVERLRLGRTGGVLPILLRPLRGSRPDARLPARAARGGRTQSEQEGERKGKGRNSLHLSGNTP
jgi:hypothetical protein